MVFDKDLAEGGPAPESIIEGRQKRVSPLQVDRVVQECFCGGLSAGMAMTKKKERHLFSSRLGVRSCCLFVPSSEMAAKKALIALGRGRDRGELL